MRAVPEPAGERRGVVAWTRSRACRPSPGSTRPSRPCPGIPARREFEYHRHGTAVLFAGLDVHDGAVAGWVTDSTRSENFVDFLGDLVAQTPAGSGPALHRRQPLRPRHRPGRTSSWPHNPTSICTSRPTHASWLNQVELFFSILERRLLRRGEFDSVDDLAERIIAFIKDYNRRAAPFRWTYDGRPLRAA